MRAIASPHRVLLLAASWLLLLAPTGCAKHADFVQVREDVRHLAKAQEQDRKQYEELQSRLASLDAKVQAVSGQPGETAALQKRTEELSAWLRSLETRLTRLGELPRPPAKPDALTSEPPVELSREPSRQSSPAKIPPLPEPMLPLPGTPDITPTSAFNLPYNDYIDGRYELAIAGFQRFVQDFPSASRVPDAHYWMGEAYYSLKDYSNATQAFERLVSEYPRSDKVPPALFKLGVVAAETGDVRKARTYFKRVIEEFSGSNEARLAKHKLAEIR